METMKDNHILYVDLTNKVISKEEITPELRRKFIGGAGINSKILFDSEAMYHDPLSEKNVLIFGVGPVVGTGLLAGNRCTITAKGPLNEMYGDSNVGGNFNLKMRSIGLDHIVFTGKSERPVYIYIDENCQVNFCDATDLWGLWTEKVTDLLQERHGIKCEVGCIGPAGEKLVRFASVIFSKRHAAGRGGMGCIMGSKNLKAVVIQSNKIKLPPAYDQAKVVAIRKLWIKKCSSSVISKVGRLEGTLFLIEKYNKGKHLTVNNCQSLCSEKSKDISSQVFKDQYQTKRKPCFACPVGCARQYEIKEGKYAGEKGDRIDYGVVAGVGITVGNFDWGSILHLKNLVDYLGMDAIECGMVIGLLMESYQRGLVTQKDVDGLDLKFGDSDQIETLIYKIGNREGIGDILAEGTYRAGIALKAEKYAFCMKKVGTGLMSKATAASSLGYLTSTRGGDHLKCFAFTASFVTYFSEVVAKHIFKTSVAKTIGSSEQKGRVIWWHENYKYIVDSLGICIFAIQGLPSTGHAYFDEFASVMNALYNLDLNDKDVFNAADRIYQLQNAFNVACGLTLEDYQWPKRIKDADIDDSVLEETTMDPVDSPGFLPEYFYYRGLTPDGKPTTVRFNELGLEKSYFTKAQSVSADDVPLISELLKTVGLKTEFSFGDKLKGAILAKLLIKLLDTKDKKDHAKFMKQMKINKITEQNQLSS